MDEELRSRLDLILRQTNSFEGIAAEVKEMSKDLSMMKGQMESVLNQNAKVEDLVLTVNTLKTQFKIVWAAFAFGFVSVGGLVVAAVFTGLQL